MKKGVLWFVGAVALVVLVLAVSGIKVVESEEGTWRGNTTIARLTSISRYRICNTTPVDETEGADIYVDDEEAGSLSGGNCMDVEGKVIEIKHALDWEKGTFMSLDTPSSLTERIRRAFCSAPEKDTG